MSSYFNNIFTLITTPTSRKSPADSKRNIQNSKRYEVQDTMEGKAHSKERYSAPGRVSWMEQDLAACSGDFKVSFKPRLPTRNGEHRKEVNVCIVGAGLAGLRCAEILIEEGVRVTIIEARERIGGRVSLTSTAIYERRRNASSPPWIKAVD